MKNRQVCELVFLHPGLRFLSRSSTSITSSLPNFVVEVSTLIGYVRFFFHEICRPHSSTNVCSLPFLWITL